MIRSIEGPRRVGSARIAAIVETRREVRGTGLGIVGSASRGPAAIVFLAAGVLSGVRPDGARMYEKELERLWPGIADVFEEGDVD